MMRSILKNRVLIVVGLFCILFTSSLAVVNNTHALTASGYNAGNIISDSVFTNTNSMNVSQIQAFLNSKVPTCDTYGTQPSEYGGGTRAQWAANASLHPTEGAFYPPFTCLKDYSENGLSTAQIIYKVSQQYQINPQVIIVLLQKEQSLVTDTWPSPDQYQTATGYGCPDSTPNVCDSQYYGLTNQLTLAAALFHGIIIGSPSYYSSFLLGNNNVLWNPNTSCGSGVVNIQNRSTVALYTYTPYQPNQAAINAGYGMGDSCSSYGNRNFYEYFRDWFGYNSGPAAFKTADSPTIYMPVEGYKLTVPYTAAMQDYGVSTDSVQTVPQSYVDSMPTPPLSTGFSSTISQLVKSPYDNDEDGASVYVISVGKRYTVQSMQQVYNMGFTDSDISYLPLSYIYSIPNGGNLSNFVTSPNGAVFKVDSLGKHEIFDYSTYITQNPSDQVTRLSYYLADKIPSSLPITQGPILLRYSDSRGVMLYDNNSYYSIPDYNTFSCWGFNRPNFVPLYTLAQNNYIAPVSMISALSCLMNEGTSTFILNGPTKYSVPGSYGLSGTATDATTGPIFDTILTRSTPLSHYIKSPTDAAIWYLDSGKIRLIPTYKSFLLLGLVSDNVDIVSPNVISSTPTAGIMLADGQLVKTPDSSAVFVVSGNQRVLYGSSSLFTDYGNSWNNIATITTDSLDQYYPFTGSMVSNYLTDPSTQKVYMVSSGTCYVLSDDTLSSLGVTYSQLSTAQAYSTTSSPSLNLSSCIASSDFIKQNGQSLVYWINGGKKYPLTSYAALLNKNGGTEPPIMTVSANVLSGIPSGS